MSTCGKRAHSNLPAIAQFIMAGCAMAGCAVQPTTPPPATQWQTYQERAARLTHWNLSAKVALRWSGGAENASLNWSQAGDRSEVDLSGPLGAGAVRITHQGDRLEVERGGDRNAYNSSTPETLAAATGWPIPVNALPFWLRGVPDPDQSIERLSLQHGRAEEIRQGGWTISYSAYAPAGTGSLPTKLRITHAGNNISLRLVNARWALQDR